MAAAEQRQNVRAQVNTPATPFSSCRTIWHCHDGMMPARNAVSGDTALTPSGTCQLLSMGWKWMLAKLDRTDLQGPDMHPAGPWSSLQWLLMQHQQATVATALQHLKDCIYFGPHAVHRPRQP
jgi:hypothetical protein